ncbi:MAG TPA: hypothetical protein VK177_05655 [Flavobacteriales bacterium]|nr:hypothetical protein [Flavobacteriales bacterium]
MTNKEIYVFETLLSWYKRDSRPDNPGHFNEIFGWAKRLAEKESMEKNRPILAETFNSIPVLSDDEIKHLSDPGRVTKRKVAFAMFSVFAGGPVAVSKGESAKFKHILKDCSGKMEKFIFLLKHEGFEEMIRQ